MRGKYKSKRNIERNTSCNSDFNQVGVEQSQEPSTSGPGDDIEVQLDELAALPKKQRIWEVDFVRGLMILFVVWDHLMFDIAYFGELGYKTGLFNWLYNFSLSYCGGLLYRVTHDVFVTMFVFTSGVSCSFSRSNGKRAIKMIAFACLLTAATFAASAIVHEDFTIRFNVIHVIALSVLLWTVIEWCWGKCVKGWQKNIFGVVMTVVVLTALIVGACAKAHPWTNENPMWFFLAWHNVTDNYKFMLYLGGDYLPFLPDFGWFLVGAFLGRAIYKEKKSIFPSVNPKYVCPVTFCGRYSLWVYLVSQVVMFGLMYLLAGVLAWL